LTVIVQNLTGSAAERMRDHSTVALSFLKITIAQIQSSYENFPKTSKIISSVLLLTKS
jgi:hypothetical protein